LPPVGNDIVDLGDMENRGKNRDKRFLDRVLTTEEQLLLSAAARPEALLWSLWAAKEAAYKAVNRDDPEVCSIPRRYRVFLNDGRVVTPRGEVALRVIVTDDYVHALAAGSEACLEGMVQRVDNFGDSILNSTRIKYTVPEIIVPEIIDPSAFVRVQLLGEIARCLHCPVDDLEIGKAPVGSGAPRVFLRGSPLAAEISLSHDGRFTAFAFDLSPAIPEGAISVSRASTNIS
jgi:phosphopantetheine--protein transferase-like protein